MFLKKFLVGLFLVICVIVIVVVARKCFRVLSKPSTISGFQSLAHAYAHNDYEHMRPLYDALGHGFAYIEADVHYIWGKFFVAHDAYQIPILRSETLQSLYLDPLREIVKGNGGCVFKDCTQLTLVIDIKSDADVTYAALNEVFGEYTDILTCWGANECTEEKPIRIIISGNRPYATMKQQPTRYAAYDGRMGNLVSDTSADFMPIISDNWYSYFTWNGEGKMPDSERHELILMVAAAHSKGKLIRFWNTPDAPSSQREAVWSELLDADVDLFSTDDLEGLREFLLKYDHN